MLQGRISTRGMLSNPHYSLTVELYRKPNFKQQNGHDCQSRLSGMLAVGKSRGQSLRVCRWWPVLQRVQDTLPAWKPTFQ